MIELLVVADDFTGALDTGVQFSSCGAATRVLIGSGNLSFDSHGQAKVLVVNSESRGETPERAYEIVRSIVEKAVAAGVPNIYKKTDSALRGNIGAELSAALDASGKDRLHFVPAFPRMDRVTRDGVHYISGLPVNESVFGKDPFEPVRYSRVEEIIATQSKTSVLSDTDFAGKKGIAAHNASTDGDLADIAGRLRDSGEICLTAGCAGFASQLAIALNLAGEVPPAPKLMDKLIVVCGSVNPITVKQMDCAENGGVPHIRLTPEQKLDTGYYSTDAGKAALEGWLAIARENSCCIFDTNGKGGNDASNAYAEQNGISSQQIRERVPNALAGILKYILEQGVRATAFLTGGDTLTGFMRQIGCDRIDPLREIAPGTVLSLIEYKGEPLQVISKSGGFGGESLLYDLVRSPVQIGK